MDQTTADRKVDHALVGLSSRTQALFLYGATAIGVSLAMLFTGIPPEVESHFGPWARIYFGLPLLVAGILLCTGSFHANEYRWAWRVSFIGMLTFGLWSATMAVTYAAIAAARDVQFAWPWEIIEADSGRLYITILYQGLFLLSLMHTIVFMRLGLPDKRVR
jgi:hypothetical protein